MKPIGRTAPSTSRCDNAKSGRRSRVPARAVKRKGKIDLYIRLSGSETGGREKKWLRALVEKEKDGEGKDRILGYLV